MKLKLNSGFTLLELLIALTIFSVVSVAAVWILFTSLALRDQTLASSDTQEAVRVFLHDFQLAAGNAKTVNTTGAGLFVSNSNECWSFVWNSASQTLKYSHLVLPGCTPEVSPTTDFLPAKIKVSNLNFTVTPLATGGREISLSGTFIGSQPLDTYSLSFTNTVVNLID